MNKTQAYSPSKFIILLLLAIFIISIVLPFANLITMAIDAPIIDIYTKRSFIKVLKQTLYVGLSATFLSVSIALILAWAIVRTQMPFKSLFTSIFALPMLIPTLSHGIGLILVFGANGIITKSLNFAFPIYGFWGIVLGSMLYTLPVAYLMIADILKYEDSSTHEAANVLGLSKLNCFTALTLPYMAKPLISVCFAVFVMVITDYGVPLMIGGKYKTLAVLMYQDVIGLLDFSKGAVISLLFLLPAIVAFILDNMQKDIGQSGFVRKPFRIAKHKLTDTFALFLCSFVAIFILLPIFSFIYLSFIKKFPVNLTFTIEHILYGIEYDLFDYLFNSIFIGICVAVIGTMMAIITAYITTRSYSKFKKVLHFFSIITLTIPGIVLGLAYVFFFQTSFIYGTYAMLILVNLTHFFASPYLMMYNSFNKINMNIEQVASILGINQFDTFYDIVLPQAKLTIYEVFSYFFINSMVTISAVAFLANIDTKPISLMISQYEANMLIELSAFVSFVILLVNISLKLFVKLLKHKSQNKLKAKIENS